MSTPVHKFQFQVGPEEKEPWLLLGSIWQQFNKCIYVKHTQTKPTVTVTHNAKKIYYSLKWSFAEHQPSLAVKKICTCLQEKSIYVIYFPISKGVVQTPPPSRGSLEPRFTPDINQTRKRTKIQMCWPLEITLITWTGFFELIFQLAITYYFHLTLVILHFIDIDVYLFASVRVDKGIGINDGVSIFSIWLRSLPFFTSSIRKMKDAA